MIVKLIDQDYIGIEFEYQQKLVNLVRSLAGAMFIKDRRLWSIPVDGLSPASVEILKLEGFSVDSGVLARLEEFASPINDFKASEILDSFPLYPFQRETAEFMIRTGSCLNANFVGSGKSLTSISVCEALKSESNLIVCPKSVQGQWQQEILKWLPNANVFLVIGDKKSRNKVYNDYKNCKTRKYLLVTYDVMRIDIDILRNI